MFMRHCGHSDAHSSGQSIVYHLFCTLFAKKTTAVVNTGHAVKFVLILEFLIISC